MDFDNNFDEYESDPVGSPSDSCLLDEQDGAEDNFCLSKL
jgi:hypothetical protein